MKPNLLFLLVVILSADSCHSQTHEESIVLINSGSYDKLRIAKEIEILNKLKPSVISLDIAFPEYSGDSGDTKLILALENCRELVMPSVIYDEGEDYNGNSMISVALTCSMEFFPPQAKTGFVSAMEDGDDIQIPKKFIVWQEGSSGDLYHHFSVVTAMVFDSVITANFLQSNDRLTDMDWLAKRRKFKTFSAADVLGGKLSARDIDGKIVMIGFLGPGNQDKFFTPLNTNSSEPDMYGVEYLANIVAQVLEGHR